LNVKFEYILDEIDIRVESIKIQAELTGNELKKKIEVIKNEILK
jgi:hypothetical protein